MESFLYLNSPKVLIFTDIPVRVPELSCTEKMNARMYGMVY